MCKIRIILLFAVITTILLFAEAGSATSGDWFLEHINIPEGLEANPVKKKLVIAIVDDGVRTSHNDLKDFIWKNEKEIPYNNIDDDGNGYVDDIHGWDVSDSDNNINPPQDRLDVFWHGTHIAGIITQIVKKAYGGRASELIEIMAVKALADKADKTYLKGGFKGIEYAVNSGADIILCAWSVAVISAEESRILKAAHDKGVLIVASVGNFPEDREQFPAAKSFVLAVAALNQQNRKIEKSNFGSFVDISAPGINISSSSSLSEAGREMKEGSSMASAIVAAAAAIVKLQHRSYSAVQITACLKNSADAIDIDHPHYIAKLGAGAVNIKAAVESTLFDGNTKHENRMSTPQGYLRYYNPKRKQAAWAIEPEGSFEGLRFRPVLINGKFGKSILKFYSGREVGADPIASYPLSELPESVYVPSTSAYVVFEPKSASKKLDMLLEYKAEPIDFMRMYCSDTVYLDTEGVLVDGSGGDNYAFYSDCKWQILAPEGKVIHFKFTEFDTEARNDLVYFFNGFGTHEKIMAIFSGPDIPPELTTWTNNVLVWFVTNGNDQRNGWAAEYRFVDN